MVRKAQPGEKTVLSIKIREVDYPKLFVLGGIDGYNQKTSFVADETYTHFTCIIDRNLDYFEEEKWTKLIQDYGGEVNITNLRKRPIITAEDRKKIGESALISSITLLTAIGGIKYFSSVELVHAAELAIIPAVTTFVTTLANKLGIFSGKDSNDK